MSTLNVQLSDLPPAACPRHQRFVIPTRIRYSCAGADFREFERPMVRAGFTAANVRPIWLPLSIRLPLTVHFACSCDPPGCHCRKSPHRWLLLWRLAWAATKPSRAPQPLARSAHFLVLRVALALARAAWPTRRCACPRAACSSRWRSPAAAALAAELPQRQRQLQHCQ